MSAHARSRSARFLGASAVAFIVATALYTASPPAADNDLWGHVYFGREILAAGALPATNQYSYTAPDDPWINHEILAECVFAFTYDRLGSPGLLGLKLLMGLATVLCMARAAARRAARPIAWTVAVSVCALLMSWGFLVRPQLFTFLGLAIVWERLGAHERASSWSVLAPLPIVFALWANAHGGVLAGIGVLGVYACGSLLEVHDRAERAAVAGFAALSVASLLVNPYGFRLLGFLVEDLSRSRPITEWLPIALFTTDQLLFKAVAAALVVGVFLNARRRHWELVVLGLAVLATFRHQRHLPLFAILAAPMLAETLDSAARKARAHGFPPLSPVSHVLLGAGLLAVAVSEIARVGSIYRELRGAIFVSPHVFPVQAVDFIKRNDLGGNLLLPFDWGEYAIWHLYPRCRVSVDGRYTTAYPDPVLDLSIRFDQGAPGWEVALEDASIALVARRQPIVGAMLARADWVYVYSDSAAFIFLRREVAGSRSFDRRLRIEPERVHDFP